MKNVRIKKEPIIGLERDGMLMGQGCVGSGGAGADDPDHCSGQPALNGSRVPRGMVLIPGGTNAGTNPLGDGEGYDPGWYPETYSMTVDSFYMDANHVTKALWDEVYHWAVTHGGYSFDNAGSGKAANHPVHTVNWYDVVKWCNARSEKEGRTPVYTVNGAVYRTGQADNVVQTSAAGYRLPTEVEWEYAARGGLESKRFPWGDTINHDHANFQANGSAFSYDASLYTDWTYHATYNDGVHPPTSPVGSFAPNGYGLYDMAGNVWEWCFDWHPSFVGSDRVGRGGSWLNYAGACRVAHCHYGYPYGAGCYIGFRAVLPLGPADEILAERLDSAEGALTRQDASDADLAGNGCRVVVPELAAARIARAELPPCPEGGAVPVEGQNWTSPTTRMEFVWIEALGMWVGKHDVTNAEYRRKDPTHKSREDEGCTLNGDRQPVVYVNFDDGKAYAAWLTERDREECQLPEGYRYRLPTGDEWMTFAQCGDGRYPWGNNWPPVSGQAGNYNGQEGVGHSPKIPDYNDGFPVTAPVDKLWENPWGLKGVGGNVEEMTSNNPGGEFGAWRGASWLINAQDLLRCPYTRLGFDGSHRNNRYGGFRLVLARWHGDKDESAGLLAGLARDGNTAGKSSQAGAPVCQSTSGKSSAACRNRTIEDLGLDLVWVEAGSFAMGSASGGYDDERPVREIRITRGYWMGKYEVTNGEYKRFVRESGYDGLSDADSDYLKHFSGSDMPTGDRHPVVWVSWNNAVRFCQWLTERERAAGRLPQGMVYRLPTEAEWEYAARGGRQGDTAYAGSNDLDAVAWHRGNSGNSTHPVGTKEANALGLHDMTGNVWEWVHDWYQNSYSGLATTDPTGPGSGSCRVFRGGGHSNTAPDCRVAFRSYFLQSFPIHGLGFRVVLGPSL